MDKEVKDTWLQEEEKLLQELQQKDVEEQLLQKQQEEGEDVNFFLNL